MPMIKKLWVSFCPKSSAKHWNLFTTRIYRIFPRQVSSEGAIMIKRIKVEYLCPNMFIHDFNCGWLENPFFSSQMLIKDEKAIKTILSSGIREVYIDTGKGIDVRDAETEEEVKQDIQSEIIKILKASHPAISAPVQEELQTARRLKMEAKKIVTNIMQDVRMGKQIEVEAVDNVVEKMVDSIFRCRDALLTLSKLKQKDEYTFMHSVNVCVLMISFCKTIGIEKSTIRRVGTGALLHDIGKMMVPQNILNKPDKLTNEEYMLMKEHVVHGINILAHTPGIYPEAIEVASQHHERYDGSGYPGKLKGNELSRFGQMASIVDVYDAITSDRVYHKGIESAEALRKLLEWSRYHFHPGHVELFIEMVGVYPIGTLVRLESGLLAIVVEHGVESLFKPVVLAMYDTGKNKPVPPFKINLAKSNEDSDRIVATEDPTRWNIKPLEYIGL